MWVNGGKHRAGLYLQAWAAWLTQSNQLCNFDAVNNFQHWEVPRLAKLSPALILGYSFNASILPFSSDSHSSQPHPKNLGLSASWWFPVLLCLKRTRGNQTNPNIDWEGFALRLRPLAGKWRSQWSRAGGKGFWQLSLTLGELHRWMHSFQSHHTAWERKSYHRTSQGFQPLRRALPQRGALTGTDVITNDL